VGAKRRIWGKESPEEEITVENKTEEVVKYGKVNSL